MRKSIGVSFIDELPTLVAEGVLDEATAERVRAHYASDTAGGRRRSRVTDVLTALSVVLVCAGIILLVAYNWTALSRSVKTGIAFLLAILPAAAGIVFLLRRKEIEAGAAEALALAQCLLFAASRSLVAQIYQLPEDPIGFLSVFLLSALALSYLWNAVGTAAVALITAQILSYFLVEDRGAPPLIHLALVLPVAPLLVIFRTAGAQARSAGLTVLLMAAAAAATILMLGRDDAELWAAAFGSFAAASAALGLLLDAGERSPFRRYGTALGMMLTFIASWSFVWQDPPRDTLAGLLSGGGGAVFVFIVLALGCLGAAALKKRRFDGIGIVSVAAPLLVAIILYLPPVERLRRWGPLLASLGVVAYAVSLFRSGWINRSLKHLNAGLVLSLAFILARFFDMTESLLARGLLFLACGVALFAFNRFIASRAEFKIEKKEAPRESE